MDDLSRLTGISRVTISKVLNGRPGVADETRRRVLAACEDYGFQPNAAARSLARRKSDQIAVVLQGPKFWSTRVWYVQEYLQGILAAAEDTRYNVLLATQGPDSSFHKDPSRLVRTRKADGVILVGSWVTQEQLRKLIESQTPYCVLGALPPGFETNSVYYDNAAGVQTALDHLIKLGHERIAYVTGPPGHRPDTVFDRIRRESFRSHLASLGERYTAYADRMLDLDALIAEVRSGFGPTAILLVYPLARQTLEQLRAHGISVPEDLSVVVFDDHPSNRYNTPRMTALHQPLVDMGYRSVELLTQLIETGATTFPTEILPMDLVAGGTTAPVRRRAGRSGA